MAYVAIGCRVLISVVFAVAVTGKLRSYRPFVESVAAMLPAPIRHPRSAAAVTVTSEAAIAVLTAVPDRTAAAAGFAIAIALNTAFIAGIVRLLRRRIDVRCACFGSGGGGLGVPHLVRDVAYVAVALVGGVVTIADALRPGGALVAAGWIIAATAGAIAAAVSIVFDDILGLFRSTALAA